MRCEAELAAHPDEPFRGVVLVPLDSVAEVHRELVMEVMVAFTNGNELRSISMRPTSSPQATYSSDEVILRRMLIVERRLADPVRERVDAERAVVHERQACRAGKEESTAGVVPEEPSNDGREDEAHADNEVDVPAVLPFDHGRAREVGHVCDTGAAEGLDDHPAEVRVPIWTT